MNFRSTKPLTLILIASLFAACSGENKPQEKSAPQKTKEIKEQQAEKEERIKTIFYSLPSPLELSLLFKREGVSYFKDKLHQISERDRYVTSVKQALNLGVYGADLSYAGLFGKHEDAIEYFATCQVVASDLSLSETFQKEFITRLEKNPNDKDTLLQVISDFFLANDNYLKENNQSRVSTYILTGGWIEGLYLGINMISEKTNAEGIRDIIIGQLNSLDNLIFLLEDVGKSPDMNRLKDQMLLLRSHYDEIQYTESNSNENQSTEDDSGELVLDSGMGTGAMSDSTFTKIHGLVSEIRSSIIR